MTVLSSQTIRHLCRTDNLVYPFCERTVSGVKTFGLSSCGYDVRVAQTLTLWPKCMHLASTVERFTVPNYLKAGVHDKSSWARRGISVKNTVIEPGWCGYLTLEIVNDTWLPISLRAGMPIAQVIFVMLDVPTSQQYRGKYQDQSPGPQPAIDEKKQ